MALLWIEGFEGFGTGTTGTTPSPVGVIQRKYLYVASESFMRVCTGRLSGYALKSLNWAATSLGPAGLTADATMILGFAFKVSNLNQQQEIASFYDTTTSGTKGVSIRVDTTGAISVYKGATLFGVSTPTPIAANTWNYIEIKIVAGASAAVTINVNCTEVLAITGKDTRVGTNNYNNTFRLSISSQFSDVTWDDCYCCDGSGTARNDFLGNMRVIPLVPDGDAGTNNWTTSAGAAHSALVDDVPVNDDTDYLETNTSGSEDLWSYADCPAGSIVKGVQINTTCRELGTNQHSLYQTVHVGGVVDDGPAIPIGSTDYITRSRVLDTIPGTSTAWTKADLDSAEFGVKI